MKEAFISVPKLWNTVKSENVQYDRKGYASYQLNLIINNTNQRLKLFSKRAIRTASAIYVNGELVGGNGIIGDSGKAVESSDYLKLYSFLVSGDTLKIVIHVSNSLNIYGGGILNELKIGTANNINKEKKTGCFRVKDI